jgi:hypothetical protein
VEHRERRVPAAIREERLESGQDAVEQLADGLPAEEALLVRDDAPEGMDELVLELVRGDVREPRALELTQRGPDLDLELVASSHDLRGLHRAWERARQDTVERDGLEERARGLRLCASFLGQTDLVLARRPAAAAEVRDRAVTHEVQAAAHRAP